MNPNIASRPSLVQSLVSGLNPEQKAAVTKTKGALLVLSGAGTGKTKVITTRIAYLLATGVEASRIVALTFTNKAAKEMKTRLFEISGQAARPVQCSTFHSFCIKILRFFTSKEEFRRDFRIISSNDQLDLFKRSLEDHGLSTLYKPQDMLAKISELKNKLITPEELAEKYLTLDEAGLISKIYKSYRDYLKLNNALDFDDCILQLYSLLKSSESLREKIQEKFSHFMVDEFQDTNYAQLSLIAELCKHTKNICAVGDDDQSIYSWRGAHAKIFEDFEELYPDFKLVKLEQNYRCSMPILRAANSLIQNNLSRKDKKLWSKLPHQDKISLQFCTDDKEEAENIALKAKAFLGKGYKESDIAILYRSNLLARPVELALRGAKLHYKVYGGLSLFERKEIQDFFAYLKIVFFPKDRISYWRALSSPSRGFGLKSMQALEECALKNACTPHEALTRGYYKIKTSSTRIQIDVFTNSLAELRRRKFSDEKDILNLARDIISKFQLVRALKEKIKEREIVEKKIANLGRIPSFLENLSKKFFINENEFDYLAFFDVLETDKKNEDNKDEKDHISLMTLHGAKGLEFPIVFICGIEDDILPHKNSGKDVSEERRLFYVGMTRAKQHLYLSTNKVRKIYNKTVTKTPSRFLKELPQSTLIETNEFNLKNEELVKKERKAKMKNILSGFRMEL